MQVKTNYKLGSFKINGMSNPQGHACETFNVLSDNTLECHECRKKYAMPGIDFTKTFAGEQHDE